MILSISSLLNGIALHTVLLLELLNRPLQFNLQVQLLLVLGVPAKGVALLVSDARGPQHLQLLLQLAHSRLIGLNLLTLVGDFLLADAQ